MISWDGAIGLLVPFMSSGMKGIMGGRSLPTDKR